MHAKLLGKQSNVRDVAMGLWLNLFHVCVCKLQVNHTVTKLILTMYLVYFHPITNKLPQQAVVLQGLRQDINGSWKGEILTFCSEEQKKKRKKGSKVM